MTRLVCQTMMALILGAALARAAAPEYAPQAQAPILSTEISGSDLAFLTGAAPETALLVQIAALTAKRAVTPEVQSLAAAVDKDQTDAAARLKALADQVHVPLTLEPDGGGRKLLQTLGKLKGPKFDKSCLDALGDTRDQLEAALQTGAASGDKEIKQFAEAGLSTLKQERERIRKLGI